MVRVSGVLAVALGAALGCSSESAEDSTERGPRGFVEDDSDFGACVEYVAARCERIASCGGEADEDVCLRQALDACPDEVFGVGSSFTKEEAVVCADAWREFGCEELRRFEVPACAEVAGSRTEGEGCFSSAQCEGGCLKEGGSECGVCVPVVEGEEVCRPDASLCPGVATCERSGCVSAVPEVACAGRCAESEVCVEEECVARSVEGADCLRGLAGPDIVSFCSESDLVCVEGKCESRGGLPDEGEPCLEQYDGGARLFLCRDGLVCDGTGKCQLPRLGENCLGSGDDCGAAMVCVDGRCAERLKYRQEGCDDSFTRCEPGTECLDGVCLGPEAASRCGG